MSKERMLAHRSLPWGQGLVRCLLPGGTVDSSCSFGAPGKNAIHEVDTVASWRGVCSCSTTNSLTCRVPTSNSPMLRRSILPLLIAKARIARAPMARAPKAPAPTARAPSAPAPVATRPIATRSKAACLPEAEWFFRVTVRFLTILLPCPSSPWSCVPPIPDQEDRPLRARGGKELVPQSRGPSQGAASKPTYPARKPARKGVDDKKADVDHHEDARVDVEAFDGLHTSPGPFVTLLLVLHSSSFRWAARPSFPRVGRLSRAVCHSVNWECIPQRGYLCRSLELLAGSDSADNGYRPRTRFVNSATNSCTTNLGDRS